MKSGQRNNKPVIQRQPRLDYRAKQLMFAVLLRNETVFKQIMPQLTADSFGSTDVIYRVVWETLVDYYQKLEHMPQYELLAADIEERLRLDPALLNNIEVDQLTEFLTFAFAPDTFSIPVETDPNIAKWTLRKVKQFITEHELMRLHDSLITEESIPTRIPDILSQLMTRVQAIDVIDQTNNTDAFPAAWEVNTALNISPIGPSFLNAYTDGGHAVGELYGLLGPYGSCKSTLAYMISVDQATMAYQYRIDHPSTKPRIAVVVSYEDRINAMRQRSMGYAARISRSVMQTMTSYADLSTTGNLREYELHEFRDDINTLGMANVAGERERVMHQQGILNTHLCLLDMTGFSRKGVGGGGIREIANNISEELRRRNAECCCVVIDYVGAMVKRHISMNELNLDDIRHHIGASVIDAKSLIGDVFNVPVWLLHQYNGSANSITAPRVPDHTEAAENRSFGENLDFIFGISRVQPNNLAVIGCTKHRRFGNKENRVIRVKGELYRVDDASQFYRVNPDTNTIENPHERARITDTADLSTTNPAAGNDPAVNSMMDPESENNSGHSYGSE